MRLNKDILVFVGFFYIGMGDKVKCFVCGLEVIDWDLIDNLWIEYGKFFGDCLYFKMIGVIVKFKDVIIINLLISNLFIGVNN